MPWGGAKRAIARTLEGQAFFPMQVSISVLLLEGEAMLIFLVEGVLSPVPPWRYEPVRRGCCFLNYSAL